MNFQAVSFAELLAPIEKVQPPERLIEPGSWPFWVGILAVPITLSQSAQGVARWAATRWRPRTRRG